MVDVSFRVGRNVRAKAGSAAARCRLRKKCRRELFFRIVVTSGQARSTGARSRRSLLEILNRRHDSHVEFVIVGGVVAALQGGSRATFDLDIVPSLEPESWAAAIDLLDIAELEAIRKRRG
jgi:hypothetical protein